MSNPSSSFHIDWRPSRLMCAALLTLGVLATVSIFLTALPIAAKAFGSVLALSYSGWLAWDAHHQPAFVLGGAAGNPGLVLSFHDHVVHVSNPDITVRGSMATVTGQGQDGRRIRLIWWPDTLPAAARRQLRLASQARHSEFDPSLATMTG